MRIRMFHNEVGSPYTEFQEMTLDEAADAVVNLQERKVGSFELYVCSEGRNPKWEPELGLVFKNGVYSCHGLGGTTWSKQIFEAFKPYKGRFVSKDEFISLLKPFN